jgi:hypothetical protein
MAAPMPLPGAGHNRAQLTQCVRHLRPPDSPIFRMGVPIDYRPNCRGAAVLATASAIAIPLLDMLPSHRLGLPPYEFDKPRLGGLDYLLVERRD